MPNYIRAVNWSLRALFVVGEFVRRFGVHLVVLALISSMFCHMWHLYRVQAVRSAAGRLQGALTEIESSQRLYVITQDEASLTKYLVYKKVVDTRLRDLCHLLPANSSNQALCASLEGLIGSKLSEMQATVQLVHGGNLSEAVAIIRSGVGADYSDRIERALEHTTNAESR